jgi:hypothetical protein
MTCSTSCANKSLRPPAAAGWSEVDAVVHALLTAVVAAEVLVDPAPAFQQLIEGGVLPLGVGSPANLYSAGVAVE